MTTVVIMPGGFHPFHAGHAELYQAAKRTFPDAEVYVAATNDTASRPFPFVFKEKLAKLAGVAAGRFVQVKSPFRAVEITSHYDPDKDTVIFVRSEKDQGQQPQAGQVKKDGTPGYLQSLLDVKKLEPFGKHAYMAYLPTVEFLPGMTSASDIRAAWPNLDHKAKQNLITSLYPKTKQNQRLIATVIKMFDTVIGGETLPENQGWAAGFTNEQSRAYAGQQGAGMTAAYQRRENQPPMENIDRRNFLKTLGAAALAGTAGSVLGQSRPVDVSREFQNLRRDDPRIQHNKDIEDMARAIYDQIVATRGQPQDRRQQQMWMDIAREKAAQKLSKYAPASPTTQQGTGFPSQGSEYRRAKDISNFESAEDSGDYIEEKWSAKYKRSINCSNPKGFSQRAHCAGRKKNESQLDEKCWDTHRQVGMKKKGSRMVPNCVPKESQ